MKTSLYVKIVTLSFLLVIAYYFINVLSLQKPQYTNSDRLNTKELIIDEISSTENGLPQIPVYPNAVFIESQDNTKEEDFQYRAVWEVGQLVPQIMNWYPSELEKDGWTIEIQPANPQDKNIQLLMAQKEDLILNLSVIRKDDSTTQIVSEFSLPVGEDYEEEEKY